MDLRVHANCVRRLGAGEFLTNGKREIAIACTGVAGQPFFVIKHHSPRPRRYLSFVLSEKWISLTREAYMTFKPNNYSTVSPYLIVADADSTIRFLQTVFGAKEIRRFADDAGRLMHAEVQLGDTVVMLADCSDEWPAMPSYVHVYVPDVDDVYRRAIAAGGISLQEPVKKEDDDKRGGVKDVGGTTWWIATKIT